MITGSHLAARRLHPARLKRVCTLLSLVFLAGTCSLFLLSPPPALAEGMNSARQQAASEGLAESRYWQILLHYKPNLFGRTVSLIDDPDFFLAEEGKTHPTAELDANVIALWDPQDPENPGTHFRCRFPARSQWLIDTLGIEVNDLPEVSCTELEEALKKVEPRSAVLIFPGNHNNSPASMFGHTLLGINGPYRSRLLPFAVNYAAHTDETNGFAYAVKGIFGFYPGYYSLLPYYAKIREYNDLERREIWEYDLNLDPEETLRMALHIWELREMASKYYFFDENCSYNLLFLLEAARPSLNLTDDCLSWVIPIDTVRIIEKAGLIDQVVYRPSKAARILMLAKQMGHAETASALDLINGRFTAQQILDGDLAREEKIHVLDVASETLEFRYYRGEVDRDTYRKQSLDLLRSRSLLGRAEAGYLEIEDPGRPDEGHGSNRVSFGTGVWDGTWYQELRLRPAYHDLIDAGQGYLPGSQIDFANLVLRYFPERGKVQLQSFDLINIVSLAPRHAFYKPVSWKVSTGFRQALFADGDDHAVYQLNPGGGFTWGDNRTMYYGLVETDLLASGRYRDHFALGLGGTLGLLANPLPPWTLHLTARHIWYELGEPHRTLEIELKQNLALAADKSLRLEVSRQRSFGRSATDAALLFNYYW